jgi:hypothetical protein
VRAGQGQAGPSTTELLVELRTLRALLTPLLEAAAAEPGSPPLPRRHPGQERPRIPCRRTELADEGGQAEQADEADPAEQTAQADLTQPADQPASEVAGPAEGLIAGEGELLRLADSEEAWW